MNKIDNSPWSQAASVNDTGVIISSNATNSMLLFNSNPNAASINIWKKAYGLSIPGANGFEPVNPLALTNGYFMEAATYSGNGSNGGRSFAVVKADRQGNTPGCEPQEPAETVIPTQSITGPNIWSPPSIYSPKLPDQLRNYSIPVSITVSTPCSNCDSVFIPPLPPDTCNSPSFRKKIGGSGNDIAADIKYPQQMNCLLLAPAIPVVLQPILKRF
ncbi:MAG: hypothetical protein IPP79_17965 [Chitinophagaceae bacterium]|nr:hypothetical protein [Chitinophagaceae bacterium]